MKPARNADLLVTVALAGVSALGVELAAYEVLRLLFALPMVFALPGYAVVAASFGRQMPEPVQRAALTLGLSLAIAMLGALVLDLTSGLTALSWSVLIVVVVWASCALAIGRRRSDPQLLDHAAPRPTSPWRVRRRDALLMLLALDVAVGALFFAGTPLPAENVQGFTSLSMLPVPARAMQFAVEVTSAEQGRTRYSLEVRYDSKVVVVAPRIVLEPGQRWQRAVVLAASPPDSATAVEATLLRTGHGTTPYRTARLWLGPPGSG
jgi:uncharacterized membrane protein